MEGIIITTIIMSVVKMAATMRVVFVQGSMMGMKVVLGGAA
jgi:hypothetical protein